MAFDMERVRNGIREALLGMGLSPNEPGLVDTPDRVARFLAEFRQEHDFAEILKSEFDYNGESGAMVIQTDIPFRAICEHHLLPFFGHAHIGYIPTNKVVGLSKLTRLVQAVGTYRPSIQEHITNKIADLLKKHLNPLGVIVVTEAEHTCMTIRGVNAPGVKTVVSAVRGVFRDVPAARHEFLSLIEKRRG